MRRASNLLARRSHSAAELTAKIARTTSGTEAADAVADLVALGYVDDLRHAREHADRRLAQGWGPARIVDDLETAGVAAGVIAEALAQIGREALAAAAARAVGDREGAVAARRLTARGFDIDDR